MATKGLEKAQEGSAKGREGRKNFRDGRYFRKAMKGRCFTLKYFARQGGARLN